MSRFEEIYKNKKDYLLIKKVESKEKYKNSNLNSFRKTYISNSPKNNLNNLDFSSINYGNIKNNDKNNKTIFRAKTFKNKYLNNLIDTHNLNSSSNVSNLKTQLNSNTKRSIININNYQSKNDTEKINSILKSNEKNSINKSKTFFKNFFKKNSISFLDRKKIKKLNRSSLKLYEIFIQRKNQALRTEESPDKNNSIINKYFISDGLDNLNNKKYFSTDSSSSNDGFMKNNTYKIKKNLKLFDINRKYGLKQLMTFNPYHYVSSMVRYCNSVEMKNISEKLSEVNGAIFNKKATSKQLFFKNKNNNKRKNKVINSVSVSMNNNLSVKGGFVWRILAKITKTNNYSSFYNACKFKGYYELWKHYSILIEQLLVKYNEFKWFLEKNKYIQEDVFNEFLTCIKIENKNDNSFTNKVFLLFDDECSGKINIKIFLFIMELISKSTNDIEKIQFFSELFTDIKLINSIKCINVFEFFEIFKKIINSPNYKKETKILYEILKKEFNDGHKIENIFISKKRLCYFLLNNIFIQKIILAFKFQYKHANILYNDEINGSFNSTVRNVKKFLNEQNEIIKMSINECDNLEYILKTIQKKEQIKNKIINLETEFQTNLIKE